MTEFQRGWRESLDIGRLSRKTGLVADAEAHAQNVFCLQVDRQSDRRRIRRRQVGKSRVRSDDAGHLAHTDVECEMRVILLRDADGVIKSSGDMRLAAIDNCTEVLDLRRLHGETERGYGVNSMAERQGYAETAKCAADEPSGLSAQAEDLGVGSLPADVEQEGDGGLGPCLGGRYVYVAVVVSLGGNDDAVEKGELLIQSAGDEFVAHAYQAADGYARREWTALPVLEQYNLAMENIHSVEIPQGAEIQPAIGGVPNLVNAAGVANLGAVGKTFGDAYRLDIADDLRGVYKMEAHRWVGKRLALGRVDNVGRGGEETSGLPLQSEILSVELASKQHGNGEEAANR